MRLNRRAALLALAAALSPCLMAGTVVREPLENERRSPMVLETDFVLTSAEQWNRKQWAQAVSYREMSRYICEDLAISYFAMDVQTAKDGRARVKVKGKLRNIGRRDKEATVQVDVVKGNRVLGSLIEDEIEIEEDDEASWGGSVSVDPSLLTSAPEPRLRVTLTVER